MDRPQRAAEAGQTLLEITVAMFLFAFLVVVMASFYPKASLSGEFGRNLTTATVLAEQQVEDIKAKTFSFVTPANYSGTQTFTQEGIAFTRSTTITACATSTIPPCPSPINGTSPNLTIVAVTVTWQEPSTNSAKSAVLTTLIHNYF